MEPSSELALVTLPGYLRFWGAFFVIVTAFIWLFKPEDREPEQEEPLVQQGQPPNGEGSSAPVGAMASLQHAYGSLWGVIKLRAVWGLVALLLTYRLGVLTVESVAGLKLIEKGVPKELLAVLVLVQFPIELVSALVAGRWAASASPSAPFLTAYWLRLIANTATIALVAAFPTGHTSLALTSPLFLLMAAISLFNSAVNSLAFTALGSLFNSISDPEMGGAYLTLLNTIANMGVILPRAPAFYLIDALTKVACLPSEPSADSHENLEAIKLAPLECPVHPADLLGPSACADAGGVCSVVRDGFYSVCWTSLAIGAVFGVVYVRYLPALLKLPLSAWRANVQLTARRPTQASNAARPPPKARSD